MPKVPAILAGAVVTIVVVAGVVLVMSKNDDPKTPSGQGSSVTDKKADSTAKINDPAGDYAFFSDPSVTKYPEKNALFGNGQKLAFEYDGTKTNNDDYATLSYQLYYIQDNGSVIPMGGGNVEGKGKGTFTLSDAVYNSNAKNRSGFLELQGTYTNGTSGTSVKLGMYPIKFDVQ